MYQLCEDAVLAYKARKDIHLRGASEEKGGLLEDTGSLHFIPINKGYYKFFPMKEPCKGPTPKERKEDQYLTLIDMMDESGIVLDCGIDKLQGEEAISYSNKHYHESPIILM